MNKFSCQLYGNYLRFMDKYKKDFEPFLQYIIDNLVKPEEKLKIKNYEDFLVLFNKIIKILKKQINKESAIDTKEAKFEKTLINKSLTKIYKTLKVSNVINIEKADINKTLLSIVDEIYVNYLYIYITIIYSIIKEKPQMQVVFLNLY